MRNGYIIEKYFIKGEGNYVIPFLLMVPDNVSGKTLIYLHPGGKATVAVEGGIAEWFVKKGYTVLIPDLPGTGETGPGTFRGDAFIDGVSFNIWFAAVLTGRSITGIRAADVSRLSALLRSHFGSDKILALAEDEMTTVLLHAAAFESSISRVALIRPLSSYHSVTQTQIYSAPVIHSAVPGMLEHYDLPDLAASLSPAPLLIIDPVDGSGRPCDPESAERELKFVRQVYSSNGVDDSLMLRWGSGLETHFKEWLND